MRTRAILSSLFLPFVGSLAWATPEPPRVTAECAVVMDAATGKVLWGKNKDYPRPPASTTKIMTALLLVEQCDLQAKIVAPEGVEGVEESSLHLVPGETLTAYEMLQALMIRSANDVAMSVAHHLAGSEAGFAARMNARARELGCENTHFVNPHGLTAEGHVSTAHDLARIARHAMTLDAFCEAAKKRRHSVTRDKNLEDLLLVSRNKLLEMDETVDGIKTGYTKAAGRCFVGSAVRGGSRLIAVVLNSQDWAADTLLLFDWAEANFERREILARGAECGSIRVADCAALTTSVRAAEAVWAMCLKGVTFDPNLRLPGEFEVQAPQAEGAIVGEGVLIDPDGFELAFPLAVSEAAPRRTLLGVAGRTDKGFLVLAAALLGGTYLMRRRARRSWL